MHTKVKLKNNETKIKQKLISSSHYQRFALHLPWGEPQTADPCPESISERGSVGAWK